MWWLDHNVSPQVADEMPFRRKHWLALVLRERDEARKEHAERQEQQQQLQAEHEKKLAAMGYQPGQPGG